MSSISSLVAVLYTLYLHRIYSNDFSPEIHGTNSSAARKSLGRKFNPMPLDRKIIHDMYSQIG